MGVMRGSRGEPHRIRHSLASMFASNQEAGKGLYIGGDDVPPTHHQHHHHQTSATSTRAATAAPYFGQWRGNSLDTADKEGVNGDGYGADGREEQYGDSGDYISGRLNPLVDHTPPPSSSSSSSSSLPSTYYSNIDSRSNVPPYTESHASSLAHSDHAHIRHNLTSQNSAHSSIHRDAHVGSLSPQPLYSNTNLLNLGVDNAYTINPLQGHQHIQPVDPLPTTMDLPWNLTDPLCFNRTPGNFDCWDIFNPDENETSTQFQLALEEEYRYWTLVLMFIPLLTVFGNILVVMSVIKEKSLKTVTNYFICSLAVADIMVAVIVMSFAVYMEVVNNKWMLSDGLCDAWVASDVLGCTASILNLTAICVDRFIAVTQPIKYAKHKNSKRVFIMLAITWVISVAIAAPIALGVNYSDARKAGDCQFFNSDFLIYSSMGSFYIPSMIMCFLYWKIYRVIRARALKARKAKQLRDVDRRALQGVIENPATVVTQTANDTGGVYGAEATVTTGLAKMDNGRVTSYNTNKATTSRLLPAEHCDANSVTNVNSNSDDNSNDDDDDESPSGSGSANNNSTARDHKKGGLSSAASNVNPKLLRNAEAAELITNPVAEELERLENEEQQAMLQFGKNGGCTRGQEGSASTSGAGQTCANEAETPFTSLVCKADTSDNSEEKDGSSPKKKGSNSSKRGQKKGVTKFNFHMRTSRKRKEKSSSKREKKATKTLAIVLGVFLVCWVPFFTLNIIKAICIRYDFNDYPACQADPILFSLFQWLGYINSFLNPVIYTIFNQEFRKAFRRLLTEPCR